VNNEPKHYHIRFPYGFDILTDKVYHYFKCACGSITFKSYKVLNKEKPRKSLRERTWEETNVARLFQLTYAHKEKELGYSPSYGGRMYEEVEPGYNFSRNGLK